MITCPVKFRFKTNNINRTAAAFWCTMFPKSLVDEIGLLDEAFSPGTGEDGDFSIKAQIAGHSIVQVPIDESHEFGEPIPNQVFPIYHKGSATFGAMPETIMEKNKKILDERWGNDLEEAYDWCLNHTCDINEHFPVIRKYASKCRHITEFGTRGVFSTYALMAGRPDKLLTYDVELNENIWVADRIAKNHRIEFSFMHQDTTKCEIEETDLLLIDTWHTYEQLKKELELHAGKVRKYILLHDTTGFGKVGEDGGEGLWKAVDEFLDKGEWKLRRRYKNNNGLTVLERKYKVSIVMPTMNHLEDALRPAMEKVREYTDLTDKEFLVVSNGSTNGTREYLRGTDYLWFDEPLGYIGAVNEGIKATKGEFVILVDNDSWLMEQDKDLWVSLLLEPFKDEKVGAVSPFAHEYPGLGLVLHSGCTAYRRSILEEVEFFDYAFMPGYMGDADLSLRIQKAGYKCVGIGGDERYNDGTFEINFPVVHTGEVCTMDKVKDEPIVRKNRNLLYKRHGKTKN